MTITCSVILFDLDGVLVDSARVVEKHWRRWALLHGLDADVVVRTAHGRRTIDTVALVAPALDAAAEAARIEHAEAPDTDGLRVFDGAAALVGSLPEGAWAVVTSGTTPTALARLRFAGISVPRVLVTADDVARGKPDPEAYLLAAERLGAEPTRCVVVEDAPAGIEAARRAGMQPVAVATTHEAGRLSEAVAVVPTVGAIRVTPENGALRVELPEPEPTETA